jgi:hypothetical protein
MLSFFDKYLSLTLSKGGGFSIGSTDKTSTRKKLVGKRTKK